MSDKENSKVMIVYANDVAYLGYVDPDDLKDVSLGVRVEKPYVINIRPVENEGKLEAVVLDVLLPIEFGGVPVAENIYSGFINFLTGNIDLPGGKTHYVQGPNGGNLAVNRVASLADRRDPFLRLYNVTKIINPSTEIEMIYKAKVDGPAYQELLYSARVVDMKPIQSDGNDQPSDPMSPIPSNSQIDMDEALSKLGNVVDLTNTMKH